MFSQGSGPTQVTDFIVRDYKFNRVGEWVAAFVIYKVSKLEVINREVYIIMEGVNIRR